VIGRRWIVGAVLLAVIHPVPGGAAPLSTLEPAGIDALRIAGFFWWMAVAAAVVWVAALGFLAYCLRRPTRSGQAPAPRRVVVTGGVVLPAVLLAVLVGGIVPHTNDFVDAAAPADALRVRVAGEQWWWRVRYPQPNGAEVELANHLRLPVGRTTHVELSSDNVIHAFWVPSIAGKIDMIPGRTTYLTLEPTRTGTFRGVCAEYCGTSHARMTFDVVVVEPDEFDRWLAAEGAPARPPDGIQARAGAVAFAESGCGSCHTVRGTGAAGVIGPDLTHVGGRRNLVGGLPHASDDLEAWLRQPNHLKPGALMPPFAALGTPRLQALASYLRELR
jgi:cytochrome c oxidase subunit 2